VAARSADRAAPPRADRHPRQRRGAHDSGRVTTRMSPPAPTIARSARSSRPCRTGSSTRASASRGWSARSSSRSCACRAGDPSR
jgi:hypothetical protein